MLLATNSAPGVSVVERLRTNCRGARVLRCTAYFYSSHCSVGSHPLAQRVATASGNKRDKHEATMAVIFSLASTAAGVGHLSRLILFCTTIAPNRLRGEVR